jgi:hypothetical protein
MNQHIPHRAMRRSHLPSLRNALVAAGLVGAGMLVGSTASRPSAAWGEVRDAMPPQHFQSGGQMSVPLLQEISTTLHQIEARLSRMEVMAEQMQVKKTTSPSP